jgi:hypothetical protein
MDERYAGMDVHEKTMVACVLTPDGQETRTCGRMTADVLVLSDYGVTTEPGAGPNRTAFASEELNIRPALCPTPRTAWNRELFPESVNRPA